MMTEKSPPKLESIRELAPNSFVFLKDNALPDELCDEMIRRFEEYQDEQYPGRIGQQVDFDNSIKKSTDLALGGKEHWKDIDQALFYSLGLALKDFRQRFPFFGGRFKDQGYAIQRTDPGEYYHWHIDGGSHQFAERQLVAVWYLNDVPGPGGSTEFLYQNIKVQPQKGSLLLFPPFWTHEHRGETLQDGVKYIATTWLLFA